MDDTSRGPIPSSSTPPPPPETVRHNLACIDCGHNLLGAPIDANCGECGIPVAWTAKGTTLAYAPRRFLARLHLGVQMLIVCTAFATLVGICLTLVPVSELVISGQFMWFVWLIGAIGMAFSLGTIVGTWLIATATVRSWSLLRPSTPHALSVPAGLVVDEPSEPAPSDGRIPAPISRPSVRYALLATILLGVAQSSAEQMLSVPTPPPTTLPSFSHTQSPSPSATSTPPTSPVAAPATHTPATPPTSPTAVVLGVFNLLAKAIFNLALCFYLAWIAARIPSIPLFIFARWVGIAVCIIDFALGMNRLISGPEVMNSLNFIPTLLPLLVLIPLSLRLRTIRIARSAEVRSIRRGLAYTTAPAPHSLPYS